MAILSTLVVCAAALYSASAKSINTDVVYTPFHKTVNHINSMKTTWKAEVPSRFESVVDVANLCGTWVKGHPKYNASILPESQIETAKDIPESFDARTNWANCTVIGKIRDQSSCGSCWAFGSTESFEDRRCVATGEDKEFATEDTTACCSGIFCGMSMGCNGGQPSAAWNWFARAGVVSGGDYTDIGSGSSCLPYSLAPCAHHVPPTSKYPQCPSSEYPTPRCKRQCSEDKYSKSYKDDKTKASRAYSINGVEKIQTEIMTYGTVSAAFSVYEDFPTYKSGVYQHKTGGMLGGHAIAIIGWGVEDGTDYWIVKNSWNEQWGDGGTFKILRGSNECGIEDDVNGGTFD